MTLLSHTRSPYGPQRQDIGAAIASSAASHAPMIKRFCKLALAAMLFAAVTAGIIGLRLSLWFPPFHH